MTNNINNIKQLRMEINIALCQASCFSGHGVRSIPLKQPRAMHLYIYIDVIQIKDSCQVARVSSSGCLQKSRLSSYLEATEFETQPQFSREFHYQDHCQAILGIPDTSRCIPGNFTNSNTPGLKSAHCWNTNEKHFTFSIVHAMSSMLMLHPESWHGTWKCWFP